MRFIKLRPRNIIGNFIFIWLWICIRTHRVGLCLIHLHSWSSLKLVGRLLLCRLLQLIFSLNDFGDYLRIWIGLRKSQVHYVVVVFELNVKYQSVIVKLSFFLQRRNLVLLFVTNPLIIHTSCLHAILFHSKRFLNPFFLITIIASCHSVLFFALNLSPLKLKFVITDNLPIV
jgi:hypothetical protein